MVWVSNEGQVTTWTNTRGESINSLAPFWKFAGVTHSGGATGVTSYPQVRFGNVAGHREYVTYPNYDGVGDDYTVAFSGTGGKYPLPSGETSPDALVMKLWFQTTGTSGGTRQIADGDRYCDMRGTGSGENYNCSLGFISN